MTGGNFCRRKVPIPRPWPASIVTGAKAIALYKRQYGAPECRTRRLAAPVPMVKETGGWRFDMAAAGNEILTRTIGRNELSTLQAMHAYVDAQQDYYLQNHRWAHRIISSEGQKMACTGQPKQATSPVR